jgi:chromosomal replication initiator protein
MTANPWQQTLTALELELDPAVISTWFSKTTLYETSEDRLVIACTDSYSKNVIQSRYADKIQQILQSLYSKKMTVDFIVKPNKIEETVTGPLFDDPPNRAPQQSSNTLQDQSHMLSMEYISTALNKAYTLDNYVVGVNNRVVHAAALSVVDTPGQIYNPLFIYGSTGVGKTHLLHAIGNAIKARNPNFKITYTSTEEFVNDLITHIRQRKEMRNFRDTYRQCNVLLIDDIQFLSGKESSQEEFYHTFNALHQSGNQLVIASDREPSQIDKLTDRLVSRFRGGLMAQINPPDFETRLAIISSKAQEYHLPLSPPVMEFIAQQSSQNIRELHGSILKIKSFHITHNQPINLATVRSILDPNDELKAKPKRITPELILEAVTKYFETSLKDLVGKRRTKEIVIPRQMTMFLLRNELGMNLEEIGRILGGRDHTTILHGCERVKSSIEVDNNLILRSHLRSLRQELYS